MKLKAHISALFLSVASTALAAQPSQDRYRDLDYIFAVRDEPGQDFTNALYAATLKDPVRAYRIASLSDPENPNRFSPYNRQLVIETSIHAMQDFLDKNSANPDNRSELKHIGTINSLHEFPDNVRFETVSELNANGVYQLISKGRADLFTSTFNFLYDGFIDRLRGEGQSFTAFLNSRPEHAAQLPAFIDAVSTFGKFDDFTSRITPQEKAHLVDAVMDGVGKDPVNVVTAANFIGHVRAGDPVLKIFEERLVRDFENAPDLKTQDALGILGSWYARTKPVQDQSGWIAAMARDDRFTLEAFDRMPTARLFDSRGRNFQMHLFYNDQDGMANYETYTSILRADGWSERRNPQNGFTHFQKSQGGRTVHLYASIPDARRYEDDDYTRRNGDNIKAEIARQNGEVSVVVHRGHSYTVNATVEKIGRDAEVIFLGACGGTQFISRALERSPSAHVIASAGVGFRVINNDILRMMNQRILSADTLEWDSMERTVRRTHGEEGSYYMMPSSNIAAMFVSKFLALRDPAEAVPVTRSRPSPAPVISGP